MRSLAMCAEKKFRENDLIYFSTSCLLGRAHYRDPSGEVTVASSKQQ